MQQWPTPTTGHLPRLTPLLAALLATFALAPTTPARADTFVFDFENIPFGATTPAIEPADSVGSFTATFTSPQDPSGFQVYNAAPGFYQTLSGQYLAANRPGNALDIMFPSALSGLSVDFFLYGGATALDYTVLDGGVDGTLVATGSASATITDDYGVEGLLSFNATAFDTIILSPEPGDILAIDNLTVTTEQVPEPASIALLGLGLLGVSIARRRHHYSIPDQCRLAP